MPRRAGAHLASAHVRELLLLGHLAAGSLLSRRIAPTGAASAPLAAVASAGKPRYCFRAQAWRSRRAAPSSRAPATASRRLSSSRHANDSRMPLSRVTSRGTRLSSSALELALLGSGGCPLLLALLRLLRVTAVSEAGQPVSEVSRC
jgi:hypothetical protein